MQILNTIMILYHHVSFTEVKFCKNHLLLCPWFALMLVAVAIAKFEVKMIWASVVIPKPSPWGSVQKSPSMIQPQNTNPHNQTIHPKKTVVSNQVSTNHRCSIKVALRRPSLQKQLQRSAGPRQDLVDLRTKPMLFQWQHQQQRKRRHH